MADIYRVVAQSIDVGEALTAIADPGTGGQAIFLGTVRNEFNGRPSRGLFYEAYQEMAEKEMRQIGDELKVEFGARHVVMIHRVGELALGEISVVVAVSAPHRPQAFSACRAGIDRLKARVPIWKKERWADGEDSWHYDDEAPSP